MVEPKSLDSLFKEKLFRIPDYQRGYAWGHKELKAFWEDLGTVDIHASQSMVAASWTIAR